MTRFIYADAGPDPAESPLPGLGSPSDSLTTFAGLMGHPGENTPQANPDALATLRRLRQELGDEIERMIAIADALDGDPDLEPYLAGVDGPGDDREVDDDGEETALEMHGRGFKASGGDDAEDDDPDHGIDDLPHDGELDKGEADTADDEPSLGWTLAQSENQPALMPTGDGFDGEADPNDRLPRHRAKGGTDAVPNVELQPALFGRPKVTISGQPDIEPDRDVHLVRPSDGYRVTIPPGRCQRETERAIRASGFVTAVRDPRTGEALSAVRLT